MGTNCFLVLVVIIAVAGTGHGENGPKFKRSLVARFTSNPLFHKFFYHDDYQPPAYTYTATGDENYDEYQSPTYYTGSWDGTRDGNYEYSYVTSDETDEANEANEYNNNYDESYKEKDDAQIDLRFSDDNEDKKNTVQKQTYFFNTLPFYDRSVNFQNQQKNKENLQKSSTRSDIQIDEDEQDGTEENQPLFNSLPFYETSETFKNNEKSEHGKKLIETTTEENKDENGKNEEELNENTTSSDSRRHEDEQKGSDENQLLFHSLPFYETSVTFQNNEKSEHGKKLIETTTTKNKESKEKHETNKEKLQKSSTRSDIQIDEDEQDDTEENQPLFNSLPFYETSETFKNNDKSEHGKKLIETTTEKNKENKDENGKNEEELNENTTSSDSRRHEDEQKGSEENQLLFNSLPFYETSVTFKNNEKSEHGKKLIETTTKKNKESREKHETNKEKLQKSSTRSDIQIDEDEQDDTEENQPLFNSLPFYETSETFKNNEKSEHGKKLIGTTTEKNKDREDQSPVLLNLLPYYELAELFRIHEDFNSGKIKDNKETPSFLAHGNKLLIKIDQNDTVIPLRPQNHINWFINPKNVENFPDHPIDRLQKNVTEENKRQGTEYDIKLTSKNSTDGEGFKFEDIEQDHLNSQNEDSITTRPFEDDFITSMPVTFSRNPAFVSRVNPSAAKQNIEVETNQNYAFKSLPLYDNLDHYFKISNGSLGTNEEKLETQNKLGETIPEEVNLDRTPEEEIRNKNDKYIVSEKVETEEILSDRNAKRLKLRPHKDDNIHKNLIQESSLEMPKTGLRVEENTRNEEEMNGTHIYIFKSLPYFERSLPFSSMVKVLNNTFESTKEEQMETQERKLISKEETKTLKISNEDKVKKDKKKLRRRKKKVKKILVAKRLRDTLALDLPDSSSLVFGDRTKPRKKITSFPHTGKLPLAADTHPEYKVDSFGVPLNFTYDLNVENQLYNNLINKTMS